MRHISIIALLVTFSTLAQVTDDPFTITRAARSRPHHALMNVVRGGTPTNDLCENAVIHALGPDSTIVLSGDNTGSTDTEDFGNPVSWEAFSIDTCTTVTVSYCGTDPLFELVYSILIVGCPDFIANVLNSGTGFCGDGNVIITYQNLAAGTYYIPVLRTAGAEGPYTLTITSDVCDTPPLNDICVNAEMLAVVEDCAQGTVAGNSANAVINSAPPCATTSSQFQDVWYQFDSGENTEVVITLDPGTMGDIGVELRDACAGNSVFCATGDTSYTVVVEPGTNYRVRVFSNNDFGFGGTFGICITVPPADCDVGTISANGGGAVVACANGGDPIALLQDGGSEPMAWVLTDAEDTIVAVLAEDILIPDGLIPGEYRVWAVAYVDELTGTGSGSPLGGIAATGNCLDVSVLPIFVTIEICQGVDGLPEGHGDVVITGTAEGVVFRWLGEPGRIHCELIDPQGRIITQRSLTVVSGQDYTMQNVGPATGAYVLQLVRDGFLPLVKRVFVH